MTKAAETSDDMDVATDMDDDDMDDASLKVRVFFTTTHEIRGTCTCGGMADTPMI